MVNRDYAAWMSFVLNMRLSSIPGNVAHDQAFEVQFQRDSQIKVDVQCVVMRAERTGQSASCNGLKNRGFNLQVSAASRNWRISRIILLRLTKTARTAGFTIRSTYRWRKRVSTSVSPCTFRATATGSWRGEKTLEAEIVSSFVRVRKTGPSAPTMSPRSNN